MLPESVTPRLIARVCDLVGAGDFDNAASLVALLPPADRPDSVSALLRAAVAPTPEAAILMVAAGMDQEPSDERLLRALAAVNSWLSGRLDRQAFAVACAALLVSGLPASAESAHSAPTILLTDDHGSAPTVMDPSERWTAAARALGDGDAPQAIEHLQALCRTPGHEQDALEQLLPILAECERWSQALDTSGALLRLKPDDAQVRANHGLLQARLGDPDGARDTWAHLDSPHAGPLLGLLDDPVRSLAARAAAALEAGDGAAAYRAYQQLIVGDPTDASAYFGAAKALALQRRWGEALVSATLAAGLAPNDAAIHQAIDSLAARQAATGSRYAFLK